MAGTLGSWHRFDRLSAQPLIVHYLSGQEYLQSTLHYIVANFGDTSPAEPSGRLNSTNAGINHPVRGFADVQGVAIAEIYFTGILEVIPALNYSSQKIAGNKYILRTF